ncbi:amidohydrolase [Butyrivibrio sp. AC2005]|uniref:amidohydrolase n=1 Tax=Butyrivibrio sp. AC2005 TaxID=1280672 RepID=UPI00042634F6|nr:amidohydrolase [Butyrivibrio sp. AC2005]
MDSNEQLIVDAIDKRRDEIIEFANDIYKHAELGYKEFRTSAKFKESMQKLGLQIEEDLAITGVKAFLNPDRKNNFSLALMGELDALRIPTHKFAYEETKGAHCCGHHAQLAGVVGAALALTIPEIADQLDGQIEFFAVPAEEYGEVEFKNKLIEEGKIKYGGGKCELLRIGAFDDIDVALAHHINAKGNRIGSGSSNGFVSKVIRIIGKASHAAGAPEEGINALSAATLGLQALGLNRETFRDEDAVRVHPILTKGGELVNVVPKEAVIETLVRGKTIEAFTDAALKTDRSFKAGALALGADYVIETMPGYLPEIPQAFPEELKEAFRELTNNDFTEVNEDFHTNGSTDVGDVQHLLPVLTFNTGGMVGGLHQDNFDIVDEETAYILTAKMFAISAYRLLKNNAVLGKSIKDNYEPRFKNKEEYIKFMDSFNQVEKGSYK